MYVHWEDALELKNSLLDTQHRMLMLLCRKLDVAIKTRQSDRLLSLTIRELKKFTEFHFLSEENLMREIGYPDLENHSIIHTDLLVQLDMMMVKIKNHKEFPEDLLYFLNKWLVQHLVKEDLKIANFARNSERRPIGEDLYDQYLLSGSWGES
jgi:hemerythrin